MIIRQIQSQEVDREIMIFLSSFPRTLVNSKLIRYHDLSIIAKRFKQNTFQLKYSYSLSSIETVQQQTNTQSFTERAFTPSYMSKLLIQQLPKTPYETILHQLSLYFTKILPFDYDYFCQSLKRLIPYQQKLSLESLLMLFDLAIEYKIDNLILQTHFQNELYCRVYLSLKKQLAEYDRTVETQFNKTYQMLQSGSEDHFKLIEEKFKALLEEDEHENDEKHESQTQPNQAKTQMIKSKKLISKPIYNASERRNKAKNISSQTLNRITRIFLESNSRNVDFNKLLLEINTIRLDDNESQKSSLPELDSQFLLTYTRLTINLLQLYMSDYHSALQASTNTQPPKYTHRSIKQIYKLQAFYYYEVAKLIEERNLLQSATNQQFGSLVELIAGFPIRRRSFRKSIGEVFIEEAKKRQIPFEGLMKFFELSRFDNRLLQHFENNINGKEELPTPQKSIQVKEQQKSEEETVNKPLVPEIIDELSTQAQGAFRMPAQLFRKVTKKKSKSKGKKNVKKDQQEVEIDLTQSDQEVHLQNAQNQQKLDKRQHQSQKQQISK